MGCWNFHSIHSNQWSTAVCHSFPNQLD